MVDRISGLPDEILVSILSLLSLKEAQATCILSRRWQHVWSFITTLNFDAENQSIRLWKLYTGAQREPDRCKYVDWVDKVLQQHRSPNIEQFRVAFDLIGPRSCIDEWIRFAMRKGVQILELDLSFISYGSSENYRFSNELLGIRETSALKALCSEYIGFKLLKVLDFKSVDVNQYILEYFMSYCPVLERLAVCLSLSLVNLRVVGHSTALKYLVIKQCYRIKSIEIHEANLVSFTYDGRLGDLLISNLPFLVEVSLSGSCEKQFDFCYLSCCLAQLGILKLNYSKLWGKRVPVIPSLPNLKCLELAFEERNNCALLHLAMFIKKTPHLHTLVLKLQSQSQKSPFAKKRAARCSHDCLKVVEIVGYRGLNRHIELVKYLTKTAHNLEKIIFNPVDPWRSRPDRVLNQSRVEAEEELSRAEARQLKEKLPATLEVVCL